jgi:recombination protein RecT
MSNPTTAVQPKAKIEIVRDYVIARQPSLQAMIEGTGLSLNRFMSLAFNAVRKTPSLLECTKESWMLSLQLAATHGLLPDGIHGALVPYKGEVTFQPMYQGLVQRAYQTKTVTKIWAEVVYRGEEFKAKLGTDPSIDHVPNEDRGDQKDLIACYACAQVNGVTHFVLLSRKDVMRHKASSKTAEREDGMWKKHEAEAWKKTAIIALSKTLPHFSEAAQKYAELIHDTEDADSIIDIVPEAMTTEPATPKAPLQDVKERLKATAPKPAAQAQPEPELVEAERQPGEDDGPGEQCSHPEVVAQVKAGKLTIASEPPTCEACGESIEPPDLGKLIEMYGPKEKTVAAKPTPGAPCSYGHERFKGRKLADGKVLVCPTCDQKFSQKDIDALGPKQ